MFHRDFMEYHYDRFRGLFFDCFGWRKMVAVLPANIVENEVFSHQGLTYGRIGL